MAPLALMGLVIDEVYDRYAGCNYLLYDSALVLPVKALGTLLGKASQGNFIYIAHFIHKADDYFT